MTSSTFPRSLSDSEAVILDAAKRRSGIQNKMSLMKPDVVIGPAKIRWTFRVDGDFSKTADGIEDRRLNAIDRPWSWLNQVHSGEVAIASDGQSVQGQSADAIVSNDIDSVLSIATADCISAALIGDNGVVGALHAGWKGLQTAIVANTANEMRKLGAHEISVAHGPAIGECCYEFGETELESLSEQFGNSVKAFTSWSKPALNMRTAFASACKQQDLNLVYASGFCTSCSKDRYFSHRARQETERMTMIVWTDSE